MDLESSVSALIAAVTVLLGASVAYAKIFGPYQMTLSEIAFDTFRTPKRYKRIINLGIGILLASIMTVVAAYAIGQFVVIPGGIVAGLFSSVEAMRVHDTEGTANDGAPIVPPDNP